MACEAQPGEVCRPVSPEGHTASATPDDGVGAPVPRLPRGATLGRYVVLDCLGSGGMGVVYLAHDFALDRRVSLKLLRPSGKDPEGRREQLVSEAQALARVSHPNVLTVHDVGTWEDEVYLALEHVEGETLRTWLDRAPRTAAEIRGMFLQAARGLQAIHLAGLVHRDVKPENLLVGRDGRVRVADLGLAITTGSAAGAPETLRPGTPGYMPLEQHRGEPLDARADQFSLAVAIHEALVGHRPYGSRGASREVLEARLGRGPAAEVPRSRAIPPRLRRALAAALSPDRADRPASLAPLIDALASPGVNASGTLGGSLAVAASALVLLVAMVRGNATPVASAEAAPWQPTGWEFQTETIDPADPVTPTRPALPQAQAGQVSPRDGSTPAVRVLGESASVPAQTASLPGSPRVLSIGRRPAEVAASAAAPPATLDLSRLAELNGLVQALYRALSEPREPGSMGPLLGLSPAPAVGGAVATTSAGLGSGSVQMASAASPGGSGPDYVDPTRQTIDALERRLDQQIRQNRSTPEIAQTRFTLAQAIWNSSEAEETQTRALALARQSKAALDAWKDRDTDVSVVELREAVNDWISVREGPIGKPGHLVGTNRAQLKIAPVDTNRGLTETGF